MPISREDFQRTVAARRAIPLPERLAALKGLKGGKRMKGHPTQFEAHVLEVLEEQLLLDGRERTESREEVARRHYWLGAMTAREGLPVDWEFVALRMAQALAGLPEGDAP